VPPVTEARHTRGSVGAALQRAGVAKEPLLIEHVREALDPIAEPEQLGEQASAVLRRAGASPVATPEELGALLLEEAERRAGDDGAGTLTPAARSWAGVGCLLLLGAFVIAVRLDGAPRPGVHYALETAAYLTSVSGVAILAAVGLSMLARRQDG
jgi:hypothetical protein